MKNILNKKQKNILVNKKMKFKYQNLLVIYSFKNLRITLLLSLIIFLVSIETYGNNFLLDAFEDHYGSGSTCKIGMNSVECMDIDGNSLNFPTSSSNEIVKIYLDLYNEGYRNIECLQNICFVLEDGERITREISNIDTISSSIESRSEEPNVDNNYLNNEKIKKAFNCETEESCGLKLDKALLDFNDGSLVNLDQIKAITLITGYPNENDLEVYMQSYETCLMSESCDEDKNEEIITYLLEQTSTKNYMTFLDTQINKTDGKISDSASNILEMNSIFDLSKSTIAENNILNKFREEIENEPLCNENLEGFDSKNCNQKIDQILTDFNEACKSLEAFRSESNCRKSLIEGASDIRNAKEYVIPKEDFLSFYSFFKYFSQQDEAFNYATGDRYYNPIGISEETLTFLKEPLVSTMCIGLTQGISFNDVFTNDGNIGDQTLEGEELFDFRGSVINLVPQDKDNLEYSGYVKYSYFFKAPPKARAGDLDEVNDNPPKELSKRRLAVMLLYNKINTSEDAEDDDYVGYYTTISDPQIIELSQGETKSSGIRLKEVTEVYGDNPNFRIVVFYRDYFKHQNDEKREDNLRIWKSSASKPQASVLRKLKKSLPIIVDSSTNNDLESSASDEASSSGETNPDDIEDDILDDI